MVIVLLYTVRLHASKCPTEQRGGVSETHYHLKTHALKWHAENSCF